MVDDTGRKSWQRWPAGVVEDRNSITPTSRLIRWTRAPVLRDWRESQLGSFSRRVIPAMDHQRRQRSTATPGTCTRLPNPGDAAVLSAVVEISLVRCQRLERAD